MNAHLPTVIAAVASAAVFFLCCPWWENVKAISPGRTSAIVSKILKTPIKSAKERIALAKQILGLPVTAPPGLLWRTYMTRLYSLPPDANIEQMEARQIDLDGQYNLRMEGLPEWCPEQLIYQKQNYEINVLVNRVGNQIYSLPPSATREQFERVAAEKRKEFEQTAKTSKTPVTFEDWYASQIAKAFGMPKGTSKDKAWAAYGRATHLFGPCTEEEAEAVDRGISRERNIRVLQLQAICEVSDDELEKANSLILAAIHSESPTLPTAFKFFY